MLLSYVLGSPVDATVGGLALLLLFLVLRLVTRRDWIAASLVVAFLVSGDFAETGANRDVILLVRAPLARRVGRLRAADAPPRSARSDHRFLDREHADRRSARLRPRQLDG